MPFWDLVVRFIRSLNSGWWKFRGLPDLWEPWKLFSYNFLEILCLSLVGFHPHVCGFGFRKRIKGSPGQISGAHLCLPPSSLVLCSTDSSCPDLLCLSFYFLCRGLECASRQKGGAVEGLPHLFAIPYLKDHSSMLSVVQFWKEYSGRASLVSFIPALDVSKNLSLFKSTYFFPSFSLTFI